MSEWKPIETAPKDGRWFLAGMATEYDVVGGATFWAGTARFEYDYDTAPEIMFADGYYGPTIYPTHWMPLPTSPTPEPNR